MRADSHYGRVSRERRSVGIIPFRVSPEPVMSVAKDLNNLLLVVQQRDGRSSVKRPVLCPPRERDSRLRVRAGFA